MAYLDRVELIVVEAVEVVDVGWGVQPKLLLRQQLLLRRHGKLIVDLVDLWLVVRRALTVQDDLVLARALGDAGSPAVALSRLHVPHLHQVWILSDLRRMQVRR